MLTKQRNLRLTLPILNGGKRLTSRDRLFEEEALNGKHPSKMPGHEERRDDLAFARMLKEQALKIMQDVTECPPDTLPAHLARLDGLRDIMTHNVCSLYKETAESRLSGTQLAHPSTLADHLACLEQTRRNHRAPAFVNSRDTELARLNHKMDLVAGLLSQLLDQPTPDVFTNVQGEEERV